MMNSTFKALLLGTLLFLSGCAVLQPTNTPTPVGHPMSWKARATALQGIQSWIAKGSVSIQYTEKTNLASLKWEQHPSSYQFALFGPLGFGRVEILGNPGIITLTQSGKPPISAATPELLMQSQLGWQIPLSHLYYWGRGLPAPGIPAKMHFDAYNHLVKLKQEKWEIDYLEYMQVGQVDLPRKMQLTHEKLKVKLVVKDWDTQEKSSAE